jgi:hypothetical protein
VLEGPKPGRKAGLWSGILAKEVCSKIYHRQELAIHVLCLVILLLKACFKALSKEAVKYFEWVYWLAIMQY